AGSPNPLRGYVAWRGQLLEAASNRGVRDPRGARHHRDAATPCCPGLRRGPNPPRSLRQRWRQGFVLRPAARDVHSSSVAVVVSHSFSYFLTLPNRGGGEFSMTMPGENWVTVDTPARGRAPAPPHPSPAPRPERASLRGGS